MRRSKVSDRQLVMSTQTLGISWLMLLLIVLTGCREHIKTAARRGDLSQIKTLAAMGANVDSGISEAAANGHVEVVRFVLENEPDLNRRTRLAQAALYPAAVNGHAEVVKHLVEYDIDVNRCSREGAETALHRAALNGHPEVIRILLENGADINGEGRGAGTPLLWAAYAGQIGAAEMLLACGADINDKSTLSRCGTALHAAVSHDQPKMVQYLLAKGADVNAEIGLGIRPLHIAAWCERVEIARILLANGADPTLRCDGRTALEIAQSDEFRKLLQQQGTTERP